MKLNDQLDQLARSKKLTALELTTSFEHGHGQFSDKECGQE